MSKYILQIILLLFSFTCLAQVPDSTEVLKTVEITAEGAMRNAKQNAVWIQRTSPQLMRSQGGTNLAEGLSFQPGLRVENNCQNCGFTQVRMNGLDGSYTQILFDDMPLNSPLLGVYGLEQMPINLIDRIDVVRGGNNAMFGGNALAGTINIIPKKPTHNTFEAQLENILTGFKTPDLRFDGSYSHLAKNQKSGYNLSLSARWREPYNHNPEALFDSNGDGVADTPDDFSELPKIRSAALNFRGFYKPSVKNNLSYGVLALSEFRRGGNAFNLLPEQSDITEQIDQQTLGVYVKNNTRLNTKQMLSTYAALMSTNRDSYYGGKSGLENPEDEEASNFYGKTTDHVFVGGLRYFHFGNKVTWQTGAEYRLNAVNDNMHAYSRLINQNLSNTGVYGIVTLPLLPRLSADVSARYELIQTTGTYSLAGSNLNDQPKQWHVLNPRISFLYQAKNQGQLRFNVSYSNRPPQPFDEDLHVSTLQGGANFVFTPQNLKPEQAISLTTGYNIDKNIGGRILSFNTEVFFTRIQNPYFILPAQDFIVAEADTIAIIDFRQNAEHDALVYGLHAEAKMIFNKHWEVQLGGTAQRADYTADVEIFDGISTQRILRAPNVYGFGTLWYRLEKWEFNSSLVYTGSMIVANERLSQLSQTPHFADVSFMASRSFAVKNQDLQVKIGVLNILDAYQRDLEIGPMRDAAYVYGPMRPRSLYVGVVLRGR